MDHCSKRSRLVHGARGWILLRGTCSAKVCTLDDLVTSHVNVGSSLPGKVTLHKNLIKVDILGVLLDVFQYVK